MRRFLHIVSKACERRSKAFTPLSGGIGSTTTPGRFFAQPSGFEGYSIQGRLEGVMHRSALPFQGCWHGDCDDSHPIVKE